MNQLANVEYLPVQTRSLTPEAVREHVNLIQHVMAAVMKKDTHFGVIPGCKLPSLYKAGSEVLLTTFRIAVSVRVEDLSTDDAIRYRVYTTGTHQLSGVVVGEGIGECSSDEAKYKWRTCYIQKEFDATPETRRRIKYSEYQGKVKERMEVRTDPADVANTILKMAKKRAQIDLTLTATAASDIFTQDIEDLPEGMIHDEREREPTPEEKDAQFKAKHDAVLAVHSESIKYIKERIAADDAKAAAEEWRSLTQDEQRALWIAPTKGGCFTKAERDYMMTKLPKPEPQLSESDAALLAGAKAQ